MGGLWLQWFPVFANVLPVPPNHECPQSAVCDKLIRLFWSASHLQIFPTRYCFTVSFCNSPEGAGTELLSRVCAVCVTVSEIESTYDRIKVILDVIMCHQASSRHILKDCSTLTLKMKVSSFKALGGTWPVTQSHPRRPDLVRAPSCTGSWWLFWQAVCILYTCLESYSNWLYCMTVCFKDITCTHCKV